MNAVTQFNTEDLKKRIAEQTQAQFGMLIPPEMFDALITEAIKQFFETPQTLRVQEIDDPDDKTSNSWNKRRVHVLSEQLTPFKQMVWLRLKAIVAPMLDAWLKEQTQALEAKMRETLDSPVCSEPFNKTLTVLSTNIMQQQVYTSMHHSLNALAQSMNSAFSRMGIHDSIHAHIFQQP